MTRTVSFLLIAWTMAFAPAVACSRDNNLKTTMNQPPDNTRPDTSGTGTNTYLALGDSYTVGTSIAPSGSYPVQAVAQLNAAGVGFSDPVIVATNGWTTTNLLADLSNRNLAKKFDLVSLLIGVNNQYQGGSLDNFRDQFTELLGKSIGYAGNRPGRVLVLSIPDYGVTPFAAGRDDSRIASEIDAFNKAAKEITLAHGAMYLNITDETRIAGTNKAMLASDGLHYAAAEYAIWAKNMVPLFEKALGQ